MLCRFEHSVSPLVVTLEDSFVRLLKGRDDYDQETVSLLVQRKEEIVGATAANHHHRYAYSLFPSAAASKHDCHSDAPFFEGNSTHSFVQFPIFNI